MTHGLRDPSVQSMVLMLLISYLSGSSYELQALLPFSTPSLTPSHARFTASRRLESSCDSQSPSGSYSILQIHPPSILVAKLPKT